MNRRWADAATVGGLVALLVVVSVTAPRWASFLRQPYAAAVDDDPRAATEDPATPQPAAEATPEADEPERTISVQLFFESADRTGLVQEERTVPFHPELSRQIRVVVEELVRGSRAGLAPPLPAQTQVFEVFVTAGGVAYVDLSRDVVAGHAGGAHAEMLTVYAVVNTVSVNFPSIRRVQILVEDGPAATLAGHLDLSRPLSPDMTLVADAAPAPGRP